MSLKDFPLLALVAVLFVASTAVPEGAAAPVVIVHDASTRQEAILDVVRARFATSGLDLPSFQISFHDDRAWCGGSIGLYRGMNKRPQVRICVPQTGAVKQLRHTLAHELAHMWLETHLDSDTRRAFLSARGLRAWSGKAIAWHLRGGEQAAEIVTWGVLQHPILLVGIPDKGCEALRSGYVLLVGRAPIPDVSVCVVS